MELIHVKSIPFSFEIVHNFALQRSTTANTFSVMSKSSIETIELLFNFTQDINALNFKFSRAQVPSVCPTGQIPSDEHSIYHSADREMKELLTIDQTLLPRLSMPYVQSKSHRWSPPGLFLDKDAVLAYLSNFGGLELLYNGQDRNWNKLVDLSTIWVQELVKEDDQPVKNAAKLDELVSDILFTSIGWRESSIGDDFFLLCATKANQLVLFEVKKVWRVIEPVQAAVKAKFETNQKHISTLRWLSNDLVVMASLDGRICVYQIDFKGKIVTLTKKEDLCEKEDRIGSGCIEIAAINGGENFLVLVAKGTYCCGFLIDKTGKCLSKATQYISGYGITGLTFVERQTFVVCTMDAHIFLLNCTINKSSLLSLQREEVKYEMNPNYAFYGITTSPTNAMWLILASARQTYDHLTLRQPTSIFVFRSTNHDPYTILLQNPTHRLSSVYDAAEIVRYLGAKDAATLTTFDNSLNLSSPPALDTAFTYRLKLAVIAAGARFTHFRLRSEVIAIEEMRRMERLCTVIEAIRSAQLLERMRGRCITPLEALAAKYLRLFVAQHLSEKAVAGEETQLQAKMREFLMPLVEEFAWTAVGETEQCVFCEKQLPPDQLECEDGHPASRCCVTKLQTPLFSALVCPQCHRCSLDRVEDMLVIVGGDSSFLLCPICDVALE